MMKSQIKNRKNSEASITRCTSGSVMTRSQCGEERCFHSMRIYEVLKRQGMSCKTVAINLGITSAAVSATISGKNHSLRTLDYLSSIGVPDEYLCDPRKKKDAA